jgi:cytochrome b6-f complex iron-sulfur subunit
MNLTCQNFLPSSRRAGYLASSRLNKISGRLFISERTNHMNRRELILRTLLGGATIILAPAVITSCSKEETPGNNNTSGGDKLTIDLTNASYSALNTAGGSVIVQGKIVTNTGNNVFIALDSVCTHNGCTIGYNQTANNFPCPCHQSVFSATGAVINGPATTALKAYAVSKSGNILTISLN